MHDQMLDHGLDQPRLGNGDRLFSGHIPRALAMT